MMTVLVSLLDTLRGWARSRATLHLELLALRHQIQVLERSRRHRPRLTRADRLLWVGLARVWRQWPAALVIVKPNTVIAWRRQAFRRLWTWKSRQRLGRPTVPLDIRHLIRTMSVANPLWGAPRLHGELLKLGIAISQASVAKYNLGQEMSIKASYKDGVFEPLEKVSGATPGKIYTVFSDEELRDIRETFGWLKAAEKSFDFWNNPADAVYDTL